MKGWLGGYSSTLQEQLGRAEPGLELTPELSGQILELARLVAHGTERVNAPLVAYLAGRFAAARAGDGVAPGDALAEAVAAAQRLLPDA